MKQIINGKMYNTDTANFLGSFESGICGDFNHIEENLYVTKKGAYFIEYSGGALTEYAVAVSNSNCTTGSSGIKLITESEAKQWAENFLSAERYEEIFGEAEEG